MKGLIRICAVVVLFSAAHVEASWTTLDMPGAVLTFAYGIDGDRVVGYYEEGSRNHGFVYVILEPAMVLLLGVGGLSVLRIRRV